MSLSKNIRSVFPVLAVIILCLLLSVFFLSGCRQDFPTPQKTLGPEKYSLYYPLSASINGNELTLKVLDESTSNIHVMDIEKNLEIKVDPSFEGTVLIVKHWMKDFVYNTTDSAEIIVRTEEIKNLWEERIKESLDDLEDKSTKPKDIVPEVYFF